MNNIRKFTKKAKKNKNKFNMKKIEKLGTISRKKRMRNGIVIVFMVAVLMVTRIAWIQFVNGDKLKKMAYMQHTLDRKINPLRGTIYDATGKKILSISATVRTITVNPVNISKENKEKVAHILSEIFELDYEKTLKKVSKRSAIETIATKVEDEQAERLMRWMEENNILQGINIDEDTKRFYPYNNLASHIIGFCGSDNQGLDGIEALYDNELKGQTGKIIKITDAKGNTILKEGEDYVSAIDGNDIVLTIDATIQGIAEKYLTEACIDNKCTDGGSIIVMNPNNGDILAMAGYPNYNLNEPYVINDEELKNNWDNISKEERAKLLQQMWRNKVISDAYEPGSTFKLITAAAALEEKITDTDNKGEYNCSGSIEIGGVRIKCWRYYRPHGAQSLREGLMNSCNPVFIGIGQKLGVHTYYSYLEKFGFLRKTGIDLSGEGNSIFLAEDKVGPVELGTISFGQRFEITPIQMCTAVSAIANGGKYISPRVVKQIINSQTGEVTNIEVKEKEQVISEETSKKVLSMMGSVVSEGTGKNAQVVGYSLGGKTGTSEDGVNTNKYVASFVGVTPITNPELVVLVVLYNPVGEGGHGGGGVAAPVASKVLSEALPYLEIAKDNISEDEIKVNVEVPNIVGLTYKEAEKILKEIGFNICFRDSSIEHDENYVIVNQVPYEGVQVMEGSTIIIE
ncbi:MAG: PASTA domain-containing protein [Clostridiales bacterium]|nr:PASTA domain-containing protein [Clostridiales bacterium]